MKSSNDSKVLNEMILASNKIFPKPNFEFGFDKYGLPHKYLKKQIKHVHV